VAKVKLTLEVEPELRRRIKLSATARDESLREWVQRAVLHELEAEGSGNGETYGDLELPAAGTKPRGSRNPVRPRDGGNPVSEAVIEDRR
jgi:hypothetical protein